MDINWNNPEERNAYFRQKGKEYRKTHPRLTLTFDLDEYQWIDQSVKHYGVVKVSQHVKQMALEAIRMGLGAQVERPPEVPEEDLDELKFLISNAANNINQIAYQLNSRALETGVRPVAGEGESRRILYELFRLLKETHQEVSSLVAKTKT